MRSVTVNLTTFEQNNANRESAKKKKKNLDYCALELKCENKEQNALETAPVGLQEGAGGLSFTVLCFHKGMHRCPRVRDNHTAAVLYEKKTIVRDENLLL